MGTLLQDLRFAFRQLRKAPSFAITAVLTLALGIGANTAIFSLVNTLLLKPLPVPDPQRIVELAPRENSGPLQQTLSWPEYKEARSQSRQSFSNVFGYVLSLDGLAVPGQQPERILTSFVSGSYFEALGLKPAAGRLFLPQEGEVMGNDPIVVLGYDYWMKRFNGDPSVVGRTVTVDGHPLSVVGVAPKGFHGLQSFVSMAAYLPMSQIAISGTPPETLNNWQNRGFVTFARIRSDVTLKQANAEMRVVADSIARLHPDVEKNLAIEVYPEATLRVNTGDPNTIFLISALFLALAATVLLLSCVNVANLVLVRATTRAREMAIRTALGAQRSRLVQQMITESVTLSLIGGVAGVIIGMLSSVEIGRINLHADVPIVLSFDFDWRIFLYSFGAALIAGMVVGLVPAIRIARANVNQVLHEGSRGVTAGRHWVRDGLVALQLACSLVLLVVAGLFVRSLSAMQTADLGFNPDHVMNFAVDANEIGMNDEQTRALARNIVAGLHQIAGVEYVSNAGSMPFGYFSNGGDRLTIDGAHSGESIRYRR